MRAQEAMAHTHTCVYLWGWQMHLCVCLHAAVPVCVCVSWNLSVLSQMLCVSVWVGGHTHVKCPSYLLWECVTVYVKPKPWQLVNALQLLIRLWAAFCVPETSRWLTNARGEPCSHQRSRVFPFPYALTSFQKDDKRIQGPGWEVLLEPSAMYVNLLNGNKEKASFRLTIHNHDCFSI